MRQSEIKKPTRALETLIMWKGAKQPLARALQVESAARGNLGVVFAQVPVATRAAALADLFYEDFAWGLTASSVFTHVDVLADIRGDALAAWARVEADRLLAFAKERRKAGWFRMPVEDHCWPIFVALVRGGVAIEARWDPLLPIGTKARGVRGATMKECAQAIPEERRMAAIVAALGSCLADGGAWPAVELLRDFPAKEIVAWLVESKIIPDNRAVHDEVKALAKKSPKVAAALLAATAGAPVPTPLTCVALTKPRRGEDLTATQSAQLRRAGKAWDGKDVTAAARMAKDDRETLLRATLEIRTVADETGTPRYDVLTHSGDSGTVFALGTTKVVAEICEGVVECKDPRLAAGLRVVIAAKPRAPKPAARVSENKRARLKARR